MRTLILNIAAADNAHHLTMQKVSHSPLPSACTVIDLKKKKKKRGGEDTWSVRNQDSLKKKKKLSAYSLRL